MAEVQQDTESRSRQEQILMLASEGLTDKEIAARLKLSPETVGTYWRRILSKYAAASRTEVVAKVVRLQAEAEVGHLTQVSEGLREVADHLLVVLRDQRPELQSGDGKASETAQILEALSDLVVSLDAEGFVSYVNHPDGVAIEVGEPFEWAIDAVDRDSFRETFSAVLADGLKRTIRYQLAGKGNDASSQFSATLTAGLAGGVVMALKPH